METSCSCYNNTVYGGIFMKILVVEDEPSLNKIIAGMVAKGALDCVEIRYEFRYTKISTGIDGINRIFLPQSEAFPTLVASDTNDFIALKDIKAETEEEYKQIFLQEIYHKNLYRKISKEESCQIQGFPINFKLPKNRSRWMKLLGNSVSVPVIQALVAAIIETGCFSITPNPSSNHLSNGVFL